MTPQDITPTKTEKYDASKDLEISGIKINLADIGKKNNLIMSTDEYYPLVINMQGLSEDDKHKANSLITYAKFEKAGTGYSIKILK
jgi:hypothetical protein